MALTHCAPHAFPHCFPASLPNATTTTTTVPFPLRCQPATGDTLTSTLLSSHPSIHSRGVSSLRPSAVSAKLQGSCFFCSSVCVFGCVNAKRVVVVVVVKGVVESKAERWMYEERPTEGGGGADGGRAIKNKQTSKHRSAPSTCRKITTLLVEIRDKVVSEAQLTCWQQAVPDRLPPPPPTTTTTK